MQCLKIFSLYGIGRHRFDRVMGCMEQNNFSKQPPKKHSSPLQYEDDFMNFLKPWVESNITLEWAFPCQHRSSLAHTCSVPASRQSRKPRCYFADPDASLTKYYANFVLECEDQCMPPDTRLPTPTGSTCAKLLRG